jgi:hypothetical protein
VVAPLRAPITSAPELDFRVEAVAAWQYAVGPAVAFRVAIARADGGPMDSIALQVQLRISAGGRRYLPAERERLANLFGRGDQWSRSVGSLHWTNITAIVPPFTGSTLIELPVGLTYDFEVSSAQYLQALEAGEVPVDLLFSGTMFYTDEAGLLQAAMIPWEKETRCLMPVTVWREAMDAHFPDAAWIRLSRTAFDRLQQYRARHPVTDWNQTIDALLDEAAQ